MIINTIEKNFNQIEPKLNFMARQGICKNYGNCYLADQKKLQSFDASNGICQNDQCGSELTEIIRPFPWKKIGILILLLVFGSGGWCYFNCKFGDKNGNSGLLPVDTPPITTPQISPAEKIKIQIQKIQKQIDVIQKKISTSLSVTTELQQVQRQMKSIQEQISKLPDGQDTTTLQQQIANEHKLITNIYSQIIDNLNQSLETIKKQVNNSEYSSSLVSELDMRRYITEGSHGKKLIVVSLSDNYSKDTRNPSIIQNNFSTIQRSFIKVLSELKRNNSKTQFSLVTIGSGRKVVKLLTSAELATLPDRGNDSIRGQIEWNMRFGAEDLKALSDLRVLDQMVIDESIKSILYLTDNKRSYSSSNLEQGIPLAWDNAGIHLKVLTIKDCNIWEQVKAQCTSWNNESTLTSVLESFLR